MTLYNVTAETKEITTEDIVETLVRPKLGHQPSYATDFALFKIEYLKKVRTYYLNTIYAINFPKTTKRFRFPPLSREVFRVFSFYAIEFS